MGKIAMRSWPDMRGGILEDVDGARGRAWLSRAGDGSCQRTQRERERDCLRRAAHQANLASNPRVHVWVRCVHWRRLVGAVERERERVSGCGVGWSRAVLWDSPSII